MPENNKSKNMVKKINCSMSEQEEDKFLYLRFIENNHPRYYSDDRVLGCDILFRYLDNDEVSDDDLEEIHRDFANKKEVLDELKRMEVQLFSEALDNFYSEYWK